MVDTGLNTEDCVKTWQHFMSAHEIHSSDIKGIYLTHSHTDHVGAAGLLQQLTGAPVYISAADAEAMTIVCGGALADLLRRNGMPPKLSQYVGEQINKLVALTKPFPHLSVLEPGTSIKLGDHVYSVIATPGHSDGHLCFFNEQYGVLFSGDHLSGHISSNISLWPGCESNPLENYLQSLNSNCTFATS